MHLTILSVPGCPNAVLLDERLAIVLRGLTGISVSREVISDESDAAQRGMRGSPTLLIDGVDLLADARQQAGLSCRLYRDDDGRLSGAPSAWQLERAIRLALAESRGKAR